MQNKEIAPASRFSGMRGVSIDALWCFPIVYGGGAICGIVFLIWFCIHSLPPIYGIGGAILLVCFFAWVIRFLSRD
jgi:hypothetical protein